MTIMAETQLTHNIMMQIMTIITETLWKKTHYNDNNNKNDTKYIYIYMYNTDIIIMIIIIMKETLLKTHIL